METTALLDIIFPRTCAGCGGPAGNESPHLCWDCIAKLPVIKEPFCAVCGDPVDGVVEDGFVCPSCARNPPAFDIARSAVRYTGIVCRLVKDFKYHRATWLAPDLAALMRLCLETHMRGFHAEFVVCVPLHHSKFRERSYNQSRLLGSRIAAALRVPLAGGSIRRTRQTNTQTHLTAAKRKTNVEGVFVVTGARGFENRDILLIDDVMTTGATLNDCARALKADGARRVVALTFARGCP